MQGRWNLEYIGRDELATVRSSLAVWQSPERFRETADALQSRIKSTDFFNRPELAFLRDAWVISEYLKFRPAMLARLSSATEDWPDGFIKTEASVLHVEVTEAIELGRRRGDEFRPDTPQIKNDPVNDWIRRADQIPAALEKAISDKVAKRYSSPVLLLVYLNIAEWGIRQQEIEREIALIKARHEPSFSGIAVLWKDKWL